MTTPSSPIPIRLCPHPVPVLRLDGTIMDLALPLPEEVNFREMAAVLSRLPRYNGLLGATAYPVAQHSVLGAQAMQAETGSDFLAALFLLHDGHEWLLGDQTRPQQQLFDGMLDDAFSRMRTAAAAAWDDAIYRAAGLPAPEAWPGDWRTAVKSMDERMLVAEVTEIAGLCAAKAMGLKPAKRPAVRGRIEPWPAMKAEMAFLDMCDRLIGTENMLSAASAHAAHRAVTEMSAQPQGRPAVADVSAPRPERSGERRDSARAEK